MKVGIVGLPNVGKSTLFNILTRANANVSNFPFTTIEPNIGIANVKDERLLTIGKIFLPEKITPATVKFVDIAGLVKGASQGSGLGNKFLSHIRDVDAMVQVIRTFRDENIVSVLDKFDPMEEINIIELEMIMADLQQTEKSYEKIETRAKSGDKDSIEKLRILDEINYYLNKGIPLRLNPELNKKINEGDFKGYGFLTLKDILYLFNTSSSTPCELIDKLNEYVKNEKKSDSIWLDLALESEIIDFDEEEQIKFRKDLGLVNSVDDLVRKVYKMLNLITFYTVVGTEVRAWPVKKGTNAKTAAGYIHSDMEKGFIKGEVFSYDELLKAGSKKKIVEGGIVKTVGKDYIVNDGDIIEFKFN